MRRYRVWYDENVFELTGRNCYKCNHQIGKFIFQVFPNNIQLARSILFKKARKLNLCVQNNESPLFASSAFYLLPTTSRTLAMKRATGL